MGTDTVSAQWAESFLHILRARGIWDMSLREKRAGECARGHVGRGGIYRNLSYFIRWTWHGRTPVGQAGKAGSSPGLWPGSE